MSHFLAIKILSKMIVQVALPVNVLLLHYKYIKINIVVKLIQLLLLILIFREPCP